MITYTHPVIYLVVAYKNLVARQTVSIFEVMRFLNSQSLIPRPFCCMQFIQYRCQDWNDLSSVGLQSLIGQYYKVKAKEIELVLSSLEVDLAAAVKLQEFSPTEAKAVQPANDALAAEDTKAALFKDVKIYIEACIARHHLDNVNTALLVTDDHAFFKVFAQSPTAEGLFLSQVESVMKAASARTSGGNPPHMKVKLAGEIIPGM